MITAADRMQCMEVWGGNVRATRAFSSPGLRIWLRSRPYERADGGGDVYYVSSCASGRITRLLLSDVSGHGRHVAEVASGLRVLMRENINFISQRRFVREMNRQFSNQAHEDGFATALACTFFAPTRSLQFCNAGHPVPMLYRVDRRSWGLAHEWADVDPGKGVADMPLGVAAGADYSRFETRLGPGDMVLCVSDAFTESRDREGKLLGSDGLLHLVQQLDASQPDDLISDLVGQLSLLDPENTLGDDATALMFRADGSQTRMRNTLMAPLRLLRRASEKTSLRFGFADRLRIDVAAEHANQIGV